MMQSIVRELTFGAWTPWERRMDLRETTSLGGVYLIGYFKAAVPPTRPVPECLPREVIYVGDAKNLNARPLTNPHHVVGPSLLATFGEDALDFLYVSIGPLYVIDADAKRYAYQRAYSTYLENKLAWDYAKLHDHPPVLSVKSSALNREWIDHIVAKLKA